MKKLLLTATLLTATSAQALTHEHCSGINKLAGAIMGARQAGVEMSAVLSVKDGEVNDVTKMLAIDAYKEPHYSTKKYQDTSVVDFKNKWYLACIQM